MKKYSCIFSILIAILMIAAVYLAAWLPVHGEDYRITLEQGDHSEALESFVIQGFLGDGSEQTAFTLENGEMTQHTSATVWEEPDFPLSFSATPQFLAAEIQKESFTAEPSDTQSGYYEITHTISASTRLIWELNGFCTENGYIENYYAQIDTGLLNRTPYRLYHNYYSHFEGTPTQEEIEQTAREEANNYNGTWYPSPEYSPYQSLIGYNYRLGEENYVLNSDWSANFSLESAESVAEIDGIFYFVPTVRREWEGKRTIYRLDRAEKWEYTAFRGNTETIGDVTPFIEVAGGNMVDIFGLYALPNGTLALCTRTQDSKIVIQLYDSQSGSLLSESEPLGLYGVDCNFFFFPDTDRFYIGLRSSAQNQSTIVALSAQDGSTLFQVQNVDFYIRDACMNGSQMGIIGQTEKSGRTPSYQVCVYESGQPEPVFRSNLRTPAEQEILGTPEQPLGNSRGMTDWTIKRRDSHD